MAESKRHSSPGHWKTALSRRIADTVGFLRFRWYLAMSASYATAGGSIASRVRQIVAFARVVAARDPGFPVAREEGPWRDNPHYFTYSEIRVAAPLRAYSPDRTFPFRKHLQEYGRLYGQIGVAGEASTSNPRIVFIVNAWHRTGGVLSVAQLVNDLVANGHDVKLVVLSHEGFDPTVRTHVEPIFFSSWRCLLAHFPAADVVVGTLWTTMYPVMELYRTRRNFVPTYFVQDFEPAFYPRGSRLAALSEQTYTFTPYCFAKTRWICERVQRAGGTCKRVPPAIDLDVFHRRGVKRSERPVVLTMLRPATPRRGFETALSVFGALYRANSDIELHAFGSTDDELAAYAFDFPLINHGQVANSDLPELYCSADVFLECSEFHGFGRTIAESLACETPVVVTDSGGIADFVQDGVNGLIAPPGDVEALTRCVVQLLADEDFRARLARAARHSVSHMDRKHSSRTTYELLLAFWREGFGST